jgi:hypothetical protein
MTETEYLKTLTNRGLKLDLDQPVPGHVAGDPKREKRLEIFRKTIKKLVKPDGRVHPAWIRRDGGRILSANPNIFILPYTWVEKGHLDVSVSSFEIVMAARLRGEDELALKILDDPEERPFADILLELPRFSRFRTKEGRSSLKLAMYRLLYSALPESNSEREARDIILKLWSKLKPIPGDAADRKAWAKIHQGAVGGVTLAMAKAAEDVKGCRPVGFLPDMPLIEFIGSPEEEAQAVRDIKEITRSLIRCWDTSRLI